MKGTAMMTAGAATAMQHAVTVWRASSHISSLLVVSLLPAAEGHGAVGQGEDHDARRDVSDAIQSRDDYN